MRADEILEFASSHGRPVTSAELEAFGATRMSVSRLCADGRLARPVRGVYHVPSDHDDQRLVWAGLTLAYDCVFCLDSAAVFHGLSEEAAGSVEIAVPGGYRLPSPWSADTKISARRWGGLAMTQGVESHLIQGVDVRITSPARTVVDLFRYSVLNDDGAVEATVGETTFIDALNRFLERPDQDAETRELRRVAGEFGLWTQIDRYAQVVNMTKARSMAF